MDFPRCSKRYSGHLSLCCSMRGGRGRGPVPLHYYAERYLRAHLKLFRYTRWISCWPGPSFSSSSLMLLFSPSDLLTKDMDKSPWCLKRVWSPPSASPFSLHSKSVWVASGRHYSLFFPNSLPSMCCSFRPSSSWVATACTGDDFRDASSLGATDCVFGFPPFGHLFYNGLAGPRYLLEKNI